MDDKLKDLTKLYFYLNRFCIDFEKEGSICWEHAGKLPAWQRGPYWHRKGKENLFKTERFMRAVLDKHYPMWETIYGDPMKILEEKSE